MADNACDDGLACASGGALRGDIGHEFGFANGSQMLRASLTVAGMTLDEHGLLDLVSRTGVAP